MACTGLCARNAEGADVEVQGVGLQACASMWLAGVEYRVYVCVQYVCVCSACVCVQCVCLCTSVYVCISVYVCFCMRTCVRKAAGASGDLCNLCARNAEGADVEVQGELFGLQACL